MLPIVQITCWSCDPSTQCIVLVMCSPHDCCRPDLGFQASQKIMNAGPQLALVTMRDLAQNLPVQAK